MRIWVETVKGWEEANREEPQGSKEEVKMKRQHRTTVFIGMIGAALAALLAGAAPAAAPALAPAFAPVGAAQAPLVLSCSTASFGAPTNFTVGTNPYSVAVGDFNRDGSPDVATANYGSGNVSVALGNGSGGL